MVRRFPPAAIQFAFRTHARTPHGRNSSLQPRQALEVTGKVRHRDLEAGVSDADGVHHQVHSVLLPGEDMLDRGADHGSLCIGACRRSGIGRRCGLRWWMWLLNVPLAVSASFTGLEVHLEGEFAFRSLVFKAI